MSWQGAGLVQGVWWHLLYFVTFSSHLVDDTLHHGHSCALLGAFLKINFRYSSDGCSDLENQKNTPAHSVKPSQASPWCARLSGTCPVAFAGEQHVQSLCLQPGERMSSGEDLEQQPCEI